MRIDSGSPWSMVTRPSEIVGAQKSQDENGQSSVAPAPARPHDVSPGQNGSAASSQVESVKAPGQSLMDRILKDGFQKYVADIEAEKLAKLREKLLNAMGLNEEMLAAMPPDQRQAVEEMIAEEIKRRLEAAQKMNGNETDSAAAVSASGPAEVGGPSDVGGAAKPAASAGLGVLLALQEVDGERRESRDLAEAHEHGKNDPVDL